MNEGIPGAGPGVTAGGGGIMEVSMEDGTAPASAFLPPLREWSSLLPGRTAARAMIWAHYCCHAALGSK